MRVGTRITAVTSALVASTLAMYASYDLRDRAQERRLRLESETRAQAVALRTQLELQGVGRALAQADELSQELSEAVDGMRVWILPASAATRDDVPRGGPGENGTGGDAAATSAMSPAASPEGTPSRGANSSPERSRTGDEAARSADGARSGADGARSGGGGARSADGARSGADGARSGADGARSGAQPREAAGSAGGEEARSRAGHGGAARREAEDGAAGTGAPMRAGASPDEAASAAPREGSGSARAGAETTRRGGEGPVTSDEARVGTRRGGEGRVTADEARVGTRRGGRVTADGRAGAGVMGRDAGGVATGAAVPAGASSGTAGSSGGGRGSSGATATGGSGSSADDGEPGSLESGSSARSPGGPSEGGERAAAGAGASGSSARSPGGPTEGRERAGASGSSARSPGGPAEGGERTEEEEQDGATVADVGPAIERLRDLVQARPIYVSEDGEDAFAYALPLRRASRTAPDGYEVAGSIDVARSLAPLQRAWREDLVRTLPILAVIVALVVIAVMLFTRSLVSRPIEKLLAGIDDVARGDLSRVLLSEREDEIGALAARFNEMTYSLRESRAETERQNADKTKLEERLFQTEKLATIGQLAAEIAHEVGTPLNVIVGRSRAMAKKASDPEAVTKNADIVAEQASRITRIIQRLLDTARRKVGAPEAGPVDLNRITATTMDFLEGKFAAARVTRTLTRAEGLPAVKGDSDQLQQVLINLLMNAIEAMPRGGQVRVETSLVTRRRPGLEMAPEQPVVVVEVTDTGVGIPPDQRDRVFEPFYTTKEGRGGTGLGLAVSHGIIKEHDGWMEVEDAHGGPGSVFRVCLPAAGETG